MTLNQVKTKEWLSLAKAVRIELMAGLVRQMKIQIWAIFSVLTKTRWNC